MPIRLVASDFAFRRYTTDHGLSSDQTTCIFKDKQGYMWFGTVNGLNRFDGIHFKVYKRKPGGLPGNYIIGINQSPDGLIWISTHRGLCSYDPVTENFAQVLLPNQTDARGDNDFVSGMVFDSKGNGWFATPDHLYRMHLQTRKLTSFAGISQDVQPVLMYLFTGSSDKLWVMRAGALYQFDPASKKYSYFMGQDTRHLESPVHVFSLYEDSNKQLWASTFEKGLFRYDPAHNYFVDEPDGDVSVNTIVEDWLPGGNSFFWVGKGEQVLATYDPVTHQYTNSDSDLRDELSHNGGTVIQLFRDAQTGIVWMATDRGIQKSDPVEIKFRRTTMPVQTGINPSSQVKVVKQDRQNPEIYWIGLSGSGIFQWNRATNTFQSAGKKQALLHSTVHDVQQDNNGKLWIALDNELVSWHPKENKWQHWKDFFITKRAFQAVTTLYEDKKSRIWIGTSHDGVFVFDPLTQQIMPWPLAIPFGVGNSIRVYKFEEDLLNRIWVSTSRGIFRMDAAAKQSEQVQLRPLSKDIQPSDRLQSTIKITSSGNLWLSGIGFLAQTDLNGQVIKTYTQENGLLADHIFSIEEDNSGMLWMATDYLLHRLNPKTGDFTYFRKENGLYANNSSNWLSKDNSGEIFIGFTAAFNHFLPEKLSDNRQQSPVVITEVKVDNNKRITGADQVLVMYPSESTFSVEFALLNYSLPEKNQYAVMLEGFDKTWIQTDNPQASYTNLSPGNYRFRIQAANNDGIWQEQRMVLPIRVIPSFYQTGWFVCLMLVVAVCIVYAVFRYRKANRLRLEAIRNRIATDLHDDMGSTLSSIRIFSDVLQKQIAPVQPEAVPVLQRISSSATALSESMQDIIWTIQTNRDSLEDVVTRMREFGLKMAEAKQIDFRMQVSDTFHSTRLQVEQRRNLYLIFKESVNNAMKYAVCTQLTVLLEVNGKQLKMTIADNGKGFDPVTVRQGNGLQNLQKRAAEIGGKLAIESALGKGTRITLQMRLTS